MASARAGERVQRIAERVLDVDDPIVRLPEHVRELHEAARRAALGDVEARREFEAVVRRWQGRVERLGQAPGRAPGDFTIRSATEQMIKDLREAEAEQVDRVVDRWVLERARHQARQIARHETVEAYRDSYRETARESEAVVGFRWRLSPLHPRPDVCDLYANQNLYGLGPGGYPPDRVPATPHPNCLCVTSAIVDPYFMRRELARARGEEEPPRPWETDTTESAAEWLAQQPEDFQRQLLGPTRHEVFKAEPGRVITETGEPVPVHQVLGVAPRTPALGPPIAARPLVVADRATMVRPFPPLPTTQGNAEGTLRAIHGFRGEASSEEAQASLRRLFGDGVDPETLNRLGALPPGYRHRQLRVHVGRDDRGGDQYWLISAIEDEHGRAVGDLERRLTRTSAGRLIAHHDYFVLDERYQGQRIGSHVLREQFRAYRALGVHEIEVHTAWKGRYVWASMGFQWDGETGTYMGERLSTYLQRAEGMTSEEASALAASVSHDAHSVANLQDAAGRPIGRRFLLDDKTPGWEGRIDFTRGSLSRRRYAERLGIEDDDE